MYIHQNDLKLHIWPPAPSLPLSLFWGTDASDAASALTSKEGQDAHSDDALAAGAAGEAQGDDA